MKPDFAFVEGATSDLPFVARADTLDELFAVASKALLAATVEDPSAQPEPSELIALKRCHTEGGLIL